MDGIGLEGRASARPGREESRPSAEVSDDANKRGKHKPVRIIGCSIVRSLTPKEFGFRDDIVTTVVTTVARENSFAVSR